MPHWNNLVSLLAFVIEFYISYRIEECWVNVWVIETKPSQNAIILGIHFTYSIKSKGIP